MQQTASLDFFEWRFGRCRILARLFSGNRFTPARPPFRLRLVPRR